MKSKYPWYKIKTSKKRLKEAITIKLLNDILTIEEQATQVLKKIEEDTVKKEFLLQEKIQEKTKNLTSSYRKKLQELYEKIEQETEIELTELDKQHKLKEEKLIISLEATKTDEAQAIYDDILKKCGNDAS